MKKRLVTRSDFDGLVCAMLLKELDLIEEIKFVHPKDVQDGKIDISENDITTNLPFDPRVGLAFDHHESELIRNKMNMSKNEFKRAIGHLLKEGKISIEESKIVLK